MALCECGCGKETKLSKVNYAARGMVKGEPIRFVHGHNGRGPMNGKWVGDKVTYMGAHKRVAYARGKADHCEVCGNTDPKVRYQWANLTRKYYDVNDYKAMCPPCHKRHDIPVERAKAISQIGNAAILKRMRQGWKMLWAAKGQKRKWVRVGEGQPEDSLKR